MIGSGGISGGAKQEPSTPSRQKMWKRALHNAALAVGTLIVLLAGAEVVLRTAFDNKYGKRPVFFIADPTLGWKCSAGLDDTFYGPDFRIRVKTDRDGRRLGRLGEVDFGKRLVAVAGDSNVFGWGVSTEETMASLLDSLVYAASGQDARVVNLGVGGYGTMQYFVGLRDLIDDYPDATIAAVIVVHAPNDAVDNVNSIGYYFGAWKVQDRGAKERSSVHLVNLVSYAFQALEQRRRSAGGASKERGSVHPYLQDMLFGVETVLPKTLPPEVVLNERTISFKDLGDDDWSIERTLARESMTRVQRDLMSEAVTSIHKLLRGRTTRILHIVVPTAPDWFAEEVSGILREVAPNADSRIGFYGRLLDPDRHTGLVLNTHSGGHYTPEFNESWARAIMKLLDDQGMDLSGRRGRE